MQKTVFLLLRPAVWLLFLLAAGNNIVAQIQPAHNTLLNQTHIMFEMAEVPAATRYELNIYQLPPAKNTTPKKVVTHTGPHLAVYVKKGIAFGNQYRWNYRAFVKNKPVYTSPWLHFATNTSPRVMKDSFRAETGFTGKPGDELVFVDHSAIAIDKRGNPVWFMPAPADSLNKWVIRDLLLTPQGTITHLDAYGAYEKDLQGRLLWKGPDDGRVSGSAKEYYHHQLTKLADGGFIVAGTQYKNPARVDDVKYNTLIRYNAAGQIQWHWSELGSLDADSLLGKYKNAGMGGHLNGFALVPGGDKIFLSFKNYSDVLLLNIAAGRFEQSLQQATGSANPAFLQQHGPFLSASGELFIYNNNILDKESEEVRHPSIIVYQYNPASGRVSPVWEHELHAAKFPRGINGKEGYVMETEQGTVLVTAGGANYTAEIDRSGKTLWECYFYKRTKTNTAWAPYSNYRCHAAGSLYPYYTTLQYRGRVGNHHQFVLYNAGSRAAACRVIFSDPATGRETTLTPAELAPGQETLLELPVGRLQGSLVALIQPTYLSVASKTYKFNHLQ